MLQNQTGKGDLMDGNCLVERPMQESRTLRNGLGFEPLLDCREAGVLLRIHYKAVLKMARAGKLPGIRFGKLWRFRSSDLDAWMDSRVSCDHHQCRSGK